MNAGLAKAIGVMMTRPYPNNLYVSRIETIEEGDLDMPTRDYRRQNGADAHTEGLVSPLNEPRAPLPHGVTSSLATDSDSRRFTEYEFIDSRELARRLTVPTSWIRDQVRARSEDPLPHVNLGKYVRFLWGSPELEEWIRRRIVKENNRRVERVR
jgi:hypothetical protein